MNKADLGQQPDEKLMEAYKMGDSLAFEILFTRHSGKICGYLTKKLFSERETQDLTQEVFFKLHRSRHLYDAHLPFLPWLFSITRSIHLDHVKKKNLEDASPSELIEAVAPVSDTYVNEPATDKSFLNVLPVSQREAVSLRVYDDATFDEIATRLSTSPENARQLVSRGLKKLRTVWRKE